MQTEDVRFEGANGNLLAAKWMRPSDGKFRASALFAHCFTCGKDLHATRRVAEGLVREGIAVLRFDFTGIGESEGALEDTTFASNVLDLEAAARWIATQDPSGPGLFVGHSLGGAACLIAANNWPSVKAVATIGAPATTSHLAESLLSLAPELETEAFADVKLAGRSFRLSKDFIQDLKTERVLAATRALGRPLLVMHCPTDEIVGIDHARALYQAAKHPKNFISLDGIDHLLLKDPEDARFVADLIATWARRYFADVATEPREKPTPGAVSVVSTGQGYTQSVHTASHDLVADEPESLGGKDLGPAPFEWVLAGLGACTSMTLQMYADRKGWPLLGVNVHLERENRGKDERDLIRRKIQLSGPLDEEQRQRLLAIAERCPVHRSLEAGLEIRSELTEKGI